jgi:sterol desaturase/sphingolipid hydroxylase (fatty acid hydroxylase superfamily)
VGAAGPTLAPSNDGKFRRRPFGRASFLSGSGDDGGDRVHPILKTVQRYCYVLPGRDVLGAAVDKATSLARPGGVRLFDNPLLERLSHANVATLATIWGVLSLGLVIAGCMLRPVGVGEFVASLVGVALGWTLFEYCIHRFLFHLDERVWWGQRLAFIVHGCHHVDPGDPTRDLMPLPASLPVFFAFFTVFALLLPLPSTLIGFGFAGFSYLTYDLTHYACHQLPMTNPLGRLIQDHHLRHHFRNPDKDFSVTFPIWDRVFGTAGLS